MRPFAFFTIASALANVGWAGKGPSPAPRDVNPKILEAQKAINSRYTGLAGDYVPAPEDGKASWDTMYSLTQGLQYELGINPTVRNFGSGTFNAVKTRNKLPGQEDPSSGINFIRLYNAALLVKGYPNSKSLTTWDNSSAAAFDRLWSDAGLDGLTSSERSKVWPHVCRAMFRMDQQFRKLPPGQVGGSETTRQIQQWLNKRYVAGVGIPAMFLVPTTGVNSKETMTGFIMSLQHELGIPLDEITGNFGVKTQASLRAIGSNSSTTPLTGNMRYLFRSLCWFNSPTPDVTSPGNRQVHYTPADISTDAITPTHTKFLLAFQKFLQLNETATHDFPTFAQLLVAVGDPERPAAGGDGITEITTARGTALVSAGYRIIGRYLDENVLPTEPGYLGKSLKPHEPATIIASGLRFFPIFQYGGRSAAGFSYDIGRAHATVAHNKSVGFRIPANSCIYFAVDYDASNAEIDSNILPYFRGVKDVLQENGNKYTYGVYGSRNVCTRVGKEGGAKWSFVAGMAWGWEGNMGYRMPENWAFNQIKEFTFTGTGSGGERVSFGLDNNVWRVRGLGDEGVCRLD
ncbi:DUF1906 domain containing protein [Naviculisporaceae sp. PSN 640]